jgi:dihydropteroate synthase
MSERIYLRPTGISGPVGAPESALPLAGGPLRFAGCEIARRSPRAPDRVTRETLAIPDLVRVEGARDWLAALSAPRPELAGLRFERPQIMGVINVTPDSFSDGGDRCDPETAVRDGLAMWRAGATILDVGGESTRPGAEPVPPEEELRRVKPVVERLAAEGCRVSIDSRNAPVMREALAAGAALVNDVSGLTHDPDALAVVRDADVPVVLMHIQGTPQTMQQDPQYADPALDVYDALKARVDACCAAGLARERIVVDPGIGFGKTVQHNLDLLNRVALFQGLGCPVLLGISRKSTIGRLAGGVPAKDRVPGSLAAAVTGAARGVQVLRVHDVAETVQALAVWRAAELAEAPAQG